ncbi:MAG TPA: hypothetical protein DEB06_10740 [Phycisphaerales bacterium]|nr:hypothetical protein [Phycisphaerales bacterium]
MLRLAYSTVACPEWTLEQVVEAAGRFGFSGVELRSEGSGGTAFASEPGLTDPLKVRRLLQAEGIELAGLATGIRFDAPIFPPVLGHVLPSREASVRAGREAIALAHAIGAPSVRVYAFETHGRERHASALKRICERLAKITDIARNRGVTVLIENGGSFPGAGDLVEIIDRVGSPLLGACYDLAGAVGAEDEVRAGCAALGDRLWAARIRDLRGDHPCPLGEGDLPCHSFVEAVQASSDRWGTEPWMIFSWDRAWLGDLAPADRVLGEASRVLHLWAGQEVHRTHPALTSARRSAAGV